MLISDANTELYEIMREMGEDEKYKWCCCFGKYRLCPEKLKRGCSCIDCDRIIQKLKEFETDLIFITKIVEDHIAELENKENLCFYLHNASIWNTEILDFFRKKIQTICEEEEEADIPLEKTHSISKLEIAYKQITQRLIDAKIINANAFNFVYLGVCDIFEEFTAGKNLYSYGDTEAKSMAPKLIDDILKIENTLNDTLAPSVSKDYIAQQIQLLEKMPVDELQAEVQELVDRILPVASHMRMSLEYISDAWGTFYTEINKCTKRISENPVKEHSSNRLDVSLDLLLKKVDAFKERWLKEYAHVFASFDLSKFERQRVAR